MSSTLYAKVGDTVADVNAVLWDDDEGRPMDLSGADVEFRARHRARTFGGPATITDPIAGSVKYDLTAADTAEEGWFRVEWVVTYPGGDVQTFPNSDWDRLLISANLA